MTKLTDIAGIRIGHADNQVAATGCTVILCPAGATAGVDVRGGAPGTRETDLLNPVNYVDKVHGILLAGGSAFGLDAAAGVMQYLEEQGCGFDVGVTKVPIVAGAVLFDLNCGDYRIRPDKCMGYEACQAAGSQDLAEGSVGAGTGATVGKIFGAEHAMKGGIGAVCLGTGSLMVGAIVAVNCLGDIVNPINGSIVAGAFQTNPFAFLNCEEGLLAQQEKPTNRFAGNTTIGAVITNAVMTKGQATKVASMAHNGYARTIRPAHTLLDGDTIFALGTGQVVADINIVGVLAARAVEQAVIQAVTQAKSLAGVTCCRELNLKLIDCVP
ncbi:P1 family peptidase [Sporomusa sp. KB1]|jgi:L-aminopeptidase/D-esterase-like protein|uniref:P1 family peptidase n=1 Tax=Sporomusa sp. KB1 TaxID=943346 RepID=UPI0011A8FC2C|nr:P1 family peptidase [Sporomusa sp. KB1]TWH45448.1 L-aminopeptidase/D-esterase-like protein [Sporomusa sp. KB1]